MIYSSDKGVLLSSYLALFGVRGVFLFAFIPCLVPALFTGPSYIHENKLSDKGGVSLGQHTNSKKNCRQLYDKYSLSRMEVKNAVRVILIIFNSCENTLLCQPFQVVNSILLICLCVFKPLTSFFRF